MEALPLWSKILIPVVVTILMHTKYIGVHLKMMNTFFHEISHALIVLLFGGKVKEISFKTDLSGSCLNINKNRFTAFITSLSGYTGCSLLSLALLCAIEYQKVEISFLIMFIFALLAMLLYIRKTYPLVWTMCFIAINLILYMVPLPLLAKTYILYSIMMLLIISNTISCLNLLYVAITKPKESGDCVLLKRETHIPAFIWAVLFNLINLWAVYFIANKIV